MFFYFCKVLFSDFLKFNGNFVDAQKNSEYRDWAPLNKTLGLDTQQSIIILQFPRKNSSVQSSLKL